MNIFKKFIEWCKNIKHQYEIASDDKFYKKEFIKKVKQELNNKDGFFTLYNIKVDNDNYLEIVYPINIPIEYQIAGQEWQIKEKLDESANIVTRFLKTQWGYTHNIEGPEYYHLEDPTDDNISTRYIAVWNFVNYLSSKKTIYTINTILSIICLGIIGLVGYLILF